MEVADMAAVSSIKYQCIQFDIKPDLKTKFEREKKILKNKLYVLKYGQDRIGQDISVDVKEIYYISSLNDEKETRNAILLCLQQQHFCHN